MTVQTPKSGIFNDLPYVTEQLRVTKNEVVARVNVLLGKEDDIHVCFCTSLNVSGYGNSKKEAIASFHHNLLVFCESLLEISLNRQKKELTKLGWEQKKYAGKQYSKAYVDENGKLQNLKNVELLALETKAA